MGASHRCIASHMQVLSSVFSTLLVFNLIIASRILGETVTPPKVAGALLILAGAGITTGATPQGVPKAYTPADVARLFIAPPPYGWFVPLLFGVCVLASVVGIPLLERRFPLGAEGELEPELMSAIERRMSMGPGVHTLCTCHMHTPCTCHAHAMHMSCTCRHCDLGPTGDIGEQLARSLSPRRKRASKERWPSSTNTSAGSNSSAAWRTFMEGCSSEVSEAGTVGAAGAAGAACEAGSGSEVAGHDCSVETAAIVPSPPPPHPPPEPPLPPATPPSVKPLALRLSPVPRSQRRSHPLVPPQPLAPTPPVAGPRLVLPSGSPVWTSYGRQPEPPPAVAPKASPRAVSLPPAAPTTPRMQPSSSSRHVRPPPEPRSCARRARRADTPSEGSAARPAARLPFAWLLGARTPRPLPAWADPLVATGYAAALGLDEALADLCVRAYSSMLTTCDRPAAGCWDGWELYSFALVGTAAGLASALFYMPLVYRRYETTARPL